MLGPLKGSNLKVFRQDAGLTLTQVAGAMGVSRQRVHQIEGQVEVEGYTSKRYLDAIRAVERADDPPAGWERLSLLPGASEAVSAPLLMRLPMTVSRTASVEAVTARYLAKRPDIQGVEFYRGPRANKRLEDVALKLIRAWGGIKVKIVEGSQS